MRTLLLTMVAGLCLACFDSDDLRRPLSDVQCSGSVCSGAWRDSGERSMVEPTSSILEGTEVEADELWECNPDPDVDGCNVVDSHGHVACWRDYSGWAVVVVPACAVGGDQWIDVGDGMAARIL